jgi:glyoxylase-like metal-dependent hydrolase (beta-lactamase superfamily II)
VTLAVIRVLAPNPSVATLAGTNTWIVGEEPTIVIDPGPEIDEHLDEVARAAGQVAHILVTHDHEDHAAGARGGWGGG